MRKKRQKNNNNNQSDDFFELIWFIQLYIYSIDVQFDNNIQKKLLENHSNIKKSKSKSKPQHKIKSKKNISST